MRAAAAATMRASASVKKRRGTRTSRCCPAASVAAGRMRKCRRLMPWASLYIVGLLSMQRFAATADAVGATSSKKEKVRLVAEYLVFLNVDDAARAAVWFCARAFPRYEERVVNAGGSLIWQALARIVGDSGHDTSDLYRRHGDLGDMAAELLATHAPEGALTLENVEAAFHRLSVARGPAAKIAELEQLLRRSTPAVARYLIKIVTGDLRIGLKESLVEEAVA